MNKRQPHKMVKHTKNFLGFYRQIVSVCLCRLCEIGA